MHVFTLISIIEVFCRLRIICAYPIHQHLRLKFLYVKLFSFKSLFNNSSISHRF